MAAGGGIWGFWGFMWGGVLLVGWGAEGEKGGE